MKPLKTYFIYYNPGLIEFAIVSCMYNHTIEQDWTFDSIAPGKFYSVCDMYGADTLEEAVQRAQEYNDAWCNGEARIKVLCD